MFAYLCMPHYIMCEPRQVNSTWEVSRTRSGRTLARTTHRVLLNVQLVTLIRGSQGFARFESSLRVYSPTRLLGPCLTIKSNFCPGLYSRCAIYRCDRHDLFNLFSKRLAPLFDHEVSLTNFCAELSNLKDCKQTSPKVLSRF